MSKEKLSMRKAFKHTGALMMAAVIGLSIIGAAYALWFEDLTLDATVTTGTFDVDWSCDTQAIPPNQEAPGCDLSSVAIFSLDEGTTYNTWPVAAVPAGFETGAVGLSKFNAKAPRCTVDIGDDAEAANDVGDDNVMTMTIGSADLGAGLAPYTGCRFYIDIHNSGTVPSHITILDKVVPDGVTITSVTGAYFGNSTQNGGIAACRNLFQSAAEGPLVVEGNYVQLHESYHLGCVVQVTLDQDADEGATLDWTIELKAHQWNETP